MFMEIKKDISLFKRFKFYYEYKRIIKTIKPTLENEFNVRVDYVNRLYTVINIDKDMIGDSFYLKSSDIRRMSEPYIKAYRKELFTYLDANGLSELYIDYDIIQGVGKGSYLMVIGCSTLNTVKWFKLRVGISIMFLISMFYFLIF